MNLAWVALSGAVGAMARFLVNQFITQIAPSFQMGTFTVNLSGAFLMGIISAIILIDDSHQILKLFAIIGFLGSYTTYSTYSFEGHSAFIPGALFNKHRLPWRKCSAGLPRYNSWTLDGSVF